MDRQTPVTNAILKAVETLGAATPNEIRKAFPELDTQSLGPMLHALMKKGRLARTEDKRWCLTGG